MENAYDFLFKLVTCANSLNPTATIEYGENGLQFGQIYNKMENVWVNLHHLQKGEYVVNLVRRYNLVKSNEDVILALIVRFKVVQNMLTMLKMKGIHVAQSCVFMFIWAMGGGKGWS